MIFISKEMVYGEEGIIFLESINQYGIVIINRKSHPCIYVTFPGVDHFGDYVQLNDYADVHGGFTFLGTLKYSGLEGVWAGWDYAHWMDYIHSSTLDLSDPNDHKWTLDELVHDAHQCVFDLTRNLNTRRKE